MTAVLMARSLGLHEFGRFSLASLVIMFVGSLQQAAVTSPMMSLGPQKSATAAPAYFGAAFIQQIIFTIASTTAVITFAIIAIYIYPQWNIGDLIWPMIFAINACNFQDFLRRYLFTISLSSTAFGLDLTRYVGQLILLGSIFCFAPDSMSSANALWVIGATSAIACISTINQMKRISLDFSIIRTVTAEHWRFSKWLSASAILQWTSGQFFIIITGFIIGPAAVGVLRAIQNLLGVTHILFNGLENIVPIQASTQFVRHGTKGLSTYLSSISTRLGLFTLGFCLIVSIAPDTLLTLLYGQSYSGYGDALRGYALTYVLVSLGLPLRSGLRTLGQTQSIFKAYVWSSAYAILCVWPNVLLWGINGAVLGVLITQLIIFYVLYSSWNKYTYSYMT